MRIEKNYEYNSIELYFDVKPDEVTRETLKMFKWRWNPQKTCWYNKNTSENMAIAESLKSSEDELREKKVPDSYVEKYRKEGTNTSVHVSDQVDNLSKENTVQERKMLKVPEQIEKRPKRIEKKVIDIDDDCFELDL